MKLEIWRHSCPPWGAWPAPSFTPFPLLDSLFDSRLSRLVSVIEKRSTKTVIDRKLQCIERRGVIETHRVGKFSKCSFHHMPDWLSRLQKSNYFVAENLFDVTEQYKVRCSFTKFETTIYI
jgi:hypothetical protein